MFLKIFLEFKEIKNYYYIITKLVIEYTMECRPIAIHIFCNSLLMQFSKHLCSVLMHVVAFVFLFFYQPRVLSGTTPI